MGRGSPVTLRIEPAEWCGEAAAMLAPALAHPADLAELAHSVEIGDASLFFVIREGEPIGAYVLRVDRGQFGDEGVIVAGAGALAGGSILAAVVPHIESQFSNVRRIRFHTRKPAMVRAMSRLGYHAVELIAIKERAA